MDLQRFIQEYTDDVYHAANPEAAGRYIADPCIRHEHGHRVVLTLAENKARIAGFLAQCPNPRFRDVAEAAQGVPALTTVDARGVDKGRLAAEMVFAGGPPRQEILVPRLVIRQSTAPPPRC